MLADRSVEKSVMDLYNKTMFGDRKNNPISISDDSSEPWQTIVRLNKQLEDFPKMNNDKMGKLSDALLIEKIIKPFEQTILIDYSLIDFNEFDI